MRDDKSDWRQRLALLGMMASSLPLVGWLGGIGWLVRVDQGHAAIVTTTAIGFVLLFLALYFHDGGRTRQIQAVLVLAVIGLVIAERLYPGLHAMPSSVGVARHTPQSTDAMAGITSLGLLLGGLVLFRLRQNEDSTFALAASIFGVSTSVAILLGHSFDPQSIYALPFLSGMSQYTAGLFALFFVTIALPNGEGELSAPV
ncbi:hypothetical protein [Roseivivax sp. CAU 1753]